MNLDKNVAITPLFLSLKPSLSNYIFRDCFLHPSSDPCIRAVYEQADIGNCDPYIFYDVGLKHIKNYFYLCINFKSATLSLTVFHSLRTILRGTL